MLVDPLLQSLDVSGTNHSQPMIVRIGGGQFGPHGKKFMLDLFQLRIDLLGQLADTRNTNRGIQFVDGSVGFDPDVILGYPGAPEEPCHALVTGSRIDFHDCDSSP